MPRLTWVDCPSVEYTVNFGTYVAALSYLCVIFEFFVVSKLPSPQSHLYSETFVNPLEPLASKVTGTSVNIEESSMVNEADGTPNCALIRFGICIDLSVPAVLVTDCFTVPRLPSVLVL